MKKFILTLAIGLVAILQSFAQTDLMQVVSNDPSVRVGTLESGAKYYIRSNKKDPQRANFHIVYNVGAIQEEDRQDGLAHFLEHMAFNGSKNFPENGLIDYLQSIGIAFGENLNAGTGQQYTTYMITEVPITREGIIDSVLLALHDWAGFISLNGDDIDKERGVIQEEWRMTNGNAMRRVNQKWTEVLFGKDNLYSRRTVIGSMDNLKNFTYQDIRDFYHQWYRPDMQAFIIVGDFDVDKMEAKLKSTMADIKEFDVKTPKNKVTVEDKAEPTFAVIADSEYNGTDVELNIRLTPMPAKYNNRVMKLKTDIVNDLASSMFNLRISEISQQAGAPFLSGYMYTEGYFEPFDLVGFSAKARDGEADKAFTALYTEVLRAVRGGFIESEFDRAKTNVLSNLEKAYNNRNDRKNGQFVNAYMDNFIDNSPFPSAETDYELKKQLLSEITLDEVNAQMAALVPDENNVAIIKAQSKEGVKIPTQEELGAMYASVKASQIEPFKDDVETKPLMDASKLKGSAVVKAQAGKFGSTEWTLKNGIKVVVLPTTHKADEVILNAFKKGGLSNVADLADVYSAGLWSTYENMSGIGDLTFKELQRTLTGKNVSLSPGINSLTSSYSGNSTNKDIETMFQMLYLYATAPRFDAGEWDVMVDKVSSQIKGRLADPMRIFQDSLTSTLYGGNPRAQQMNEATLAITSMQRMEKVYRDMFSSADGMTFTITGSVNLDSLKPMVEKYIGSLPVVKSKKAPAYGPYIVKFAKGKHTNHFVTKQETPKVIAFNIFNGDISNYSLSKRLNLLAMGDVLNNVYLKTIREDAGGTYVMQNMAEVMTAPTPVALDQALFMTDTSKIYQLLPLIDAGFEALCKDGPSVENLGKYKENAAKNFNEGQNSNSVWSNYLYNWYGLGYDNYTTYITDLEKVNVQSVKEAAVDFFNQGNRCIVVQLP